MVFVDALPWENTSLGSVVENTSLGMVLGNIALQAEVKVKVL